jgi:very-short-patch-repair endonuclease
MTELFNKKELKERRRELRHNMTKAEAVLWTNIKNKQISGQRFLRQFSISGYIVDFYCQKLKLAIEVDGATHYTDEELEYDKIRQDEIELLGVTFLRFSNAEIYGDLDGVLEKIKDKVELMLRNPPTPLS